MSRPQDPSWPFFHFGYPLRRILPKGAGLSPRLVSLLNDFEESLAERLRNLKPKDRDDIINLSWMKSAIETLCAIHVDIKGLITSLELPIDYWDDKWIDVYLDNSVKLMDVCIAFSSEISLLNQGHLFLQCLLHNMDSAVLKQFTKGQSSLNGWRQHVSSKNPRLDKCFSTLDSLVKTLDLPKTKNSAKGKVLMRAMYGVKMVTVLVCGISVVAYSGSVKKLVDLQAPESCLWAEAFVDLQALVHSQMRNLYASDKVMVVKELEAVDTIIIKLYAVVEDGADTSEANAMNLLSDLGERAYKVSQGLDLLAKQVDGFFQIVLSGRDALLCNLRVSSDVSKPHETRN